MTERTVQLVEDPDHPGELVLDLGDELCAELGWQVGDTIKWIDQKDGSWLMIKSTSTNILPNATQE